LNLARNDDDTWAVITDDGSMMVSGLLTRAAVWRWVERQAPSDEVMRRMQSRFDEHEGLRESGLEV
jgi:hypothetical protein